VDLKPSGSTFGIASSCPVLPPSSSTILGAVAGGYGFSRFHFRGRTSLLAFSSPPDDLGVLVIGPYFRSWLRWSLQHLTGLVIAYVTICLTLCRLMSKGYFDSIPKELDEGRSGGRRIAAPDILRIICPIAVPGTVSTLLFAFLLAWAGPPLGALPHLHRREAHRDAGRGVQRGRVHHQVPMLTAASLIGSLPTIILYLFLAADTTWKVWRSR